MTDPEGDVPDQVRRFVDEHLDTVPQLETLLMMREAGERAWLISEVAARNYITNHRAAETLQALCRRGSWPPKRRRRATGTVTRSHLHR